MFSIVLIALTQMTFTLLLHVAGSALQSSDTAGTTFCALRMQRSTSRLSSKIMQDIEPDPKPLENF